MVTKFTRSVLTLIIGLIASSAYSQIALPVHYDGPNWEYWSIKERQVDMVLRDQVASVTVTDNVINPGSRDVEIQYIFPLPPEAAVDQFTLVVNGQELTGKMLDASEARKIYNEIVRRRRDPGLLEYAGSGLFRSSAFPLGAGKSAQLVIHYIVACKKDGDLVELWYPMSSGRYCAQSVGQFKLTADIESSGDIANIYSPSVNVDIDRESANRVLVTFEARNYRPLTDFQLFYESSCEQVGATLLTYWPDRSQDGYYLMMVSPSPRAESNEAIAKDIIIVLDRSGSMSGEKIQQAREAVRFVLNNLNRDDRFNFITYNDNVEPCFESLRQASRDNIDQAMRQVDHTEASGSTNIYDALDAAVSQFPKHLFDEHRPAYIIFLTDGLPTVGNTNEMDILNNTRVANRTKAHIFTFGVGYDVNVRLLDKLVSENQGRSAYVKPNESIETKVSSLYSRIKNPFMTNVKMALDGFQTRDDCPAELGDLFEGDQLFRAGRIYPNSEVAKQHVKSGDYPVKLSISGILQGERQTFEYTVNMDTGGRSSSHRFVEKVWASRRIGQLLDEIQLHGRVEEVVDELIKLSKKYGIVTPYTSFLADEGRDFSASQEIRRETSNLLEKSAGLTSGPQAQMDAVTRSAAKESAMPRAASDEGFAMKLGASSLRDYESGQVEEIRTIQIVGNETLYKRGDIWLTADVADLDPVKDRNKFFIIQRFSDEYFELVSQNSIEENQILSFQKSNEKLAINLRGIAYLIE